MRYATHFWWIRGESRWHLVVKESKFAGAHESPQKVHSFFLTNHRRASTGTTSSSTTSSSSTNLLYKTELCPFFCLLNRGKPKRTGGVQEVPIILRWNLLCAGWALLVHQTVRFTIVGHLPGGHRCNTWRIGMPKLFRLSNGMF